MSEQEQQVVLQEELRTQMLQELADLFVEKEAKLLSHVRKKFPQNQLGAVDYEDVLATVMEKVTRSIRTRDLVRDPIDNLEAFVMGSINFLTVDFLRTNQRYGTDAELFETDGSAVQPHKLSELENDVEYDSERSAIAYAIKSLTIGQAAVIALDVYGNYKDVEMAELLTQICPNKPMTHGSVKALLFRGRATLAGRIDQMMEVFSESYYQAGTDEEILAEILTEYRQTYEDYTLEDEELDLPEEIDADLQHFIDTESSDTDDSEENIDISSSEVNTDDDEDLQETEQDEITDQVIPATKTLTTEVTQPEVASPEQPITRPLTEKEHAVLSYFLNPSLRKRLLSRATFLLGSDARAGVTADDVVQMVAESLYRYILRRSATTADSVINPKALVYQAITYKVYDVIRKASNRYETHADILESILPTVLTPERIIDQEEGVARIYSVIRLLPPVQQQLIKLRYIDGYQPAEMLSMFKAEEPTLRIGTLKKRLHDARKKLQELLLREIDRYTLERSGIKKKQEATDQNENTTPTSLLGADSRVIAALLGKSLERN